ncbi:MAG: hypothetical protein EBR82_60995 [Caulobacteraceae bacterium]|nr:hypothetical protein [Caulobacteraceae bacterium]
MRVINFIYLQQREASQILNLKHLRILFMLVLSLKRVPVMAKFLLKCRMGMSLMNCIMCRLLVLLIRI